MVGNLGRQSGCRCRTRTSDLGAVGRFGVWRTADPSISVVLDRFGDHVVNVSATIAEVANSGTPLVLAALTKGGLAAAARWLAVWVHLCTG
jgi:hypothetical protein